MRSTPWRPRHPILTGLELERYGVRWTHAPAVLAHVLPDDRCAVLSRDLDRTVASLAAFAPGDGDVWRSEFEGWSRLRDDLLDALFTPFPPVRPGLRLLRRHRIAELVRLARMMVMPSGAFGDERFGGEGAKLLPAGNAFHADLGPATPEAPCSAG